MATRMQQRRGTAQQWTDADPILAAGEIGFETDTNQFKIGDGVNAWSDLSYFKNLEDLGGSLDDYVLTETIGQANGVAGLDNTGKIPSSQIPALVGLDTEIASAVSTAVADLVDGAPAALNTLNEIATLIGDGSNLGASIVGALGELDTTIATHTETTLSVHGIANTADLATQDHVATVLGTHATDSTNVHGVADMGALITTSAVDTKISTHNDDTTSVHGIADTSELATKTYANDAVSTHQSDTTNVHGIADTSALALSVDVTSAISTHSSDTTDVHGITNTANLVYTADARLSDERTPSAGSVTAAKIATDAVETAKIKDLNVTAAKLAADAVTTAKVADASITTAKIADGSVTTAKIANGAVTATMVGLGNVNNTSDADKPVSTATQTALDAKLSLSGGTLTGPLTLSGAPTSDLHAATKLYVDGLAAGINFHQAVVAASAGNLAGVYDNGTNGLGATLTASANGAIGTIDGASVSVGNRILLRAQTDATQNGIYTVTNVGGASAKWVVTRAADADNNPAGELATGDFTFVTGGSTNGSKGFILSTTGTITIGTTNVNYTQFNASEAVIAGTNITKAGATIAVADAPTFSGAVTASSGIVFSDGTQTKVGVPSITTFATAISSSATLATGEQDKFVPLTGAVTITLPATGYSTGQSIDFYQASGTGAAFASTNSVVGTPGLKFRTTNSVVTAMKTASGWLVFGDLSA